MPMRMPKGPIEKPKDRKKVLLRLGGYIYAHRWLALGAIGLTAASNLLALLGPMLHRLQKSLMKRGYRPKHKCVILRGRIKMAGYRRGIMYR